MRLPLKVRVTARTHSCSLFCAPCQAAAVMLWSGSAPARGLSAVHVPWPGRSGEAASSSEIELEDAYISELLSYSLERLHKVRSAYGSFLHRGSGGIPAGRPARGDRTKRILAARTHTVPAGRVQKPCRKYCIHNLSVFLGAAPGVAACCLCTYLLFCLHTAPSATAEPRTARNDRSPSCCRRRRTVCAVRSRMWRCHSTVHSSPPHSAPPPCGARCRR
jgi:hypothetical protein